MGAKPTGTHLEPVIVRMLETKGGSAQRSAIVEFVEAEWKLAGGGAMSRNTTTNSVKKALAVLRNQGIVENPTHGYYRLTTSTEDLDVSSRPPESGTESASPPDNCDLVIEESEEFSPAEAELGEGAQAVYAFYLPTYRTHAQRDGSSGWPIKVGMTTTSVEVRMAAHRTALPEPPVVGLVIRTENAALAEKVIHGVLTLRGRRLDDSGGSEWFVTSPEEIASVWRRVVEDDDGDRA